MTSSESVDVRGRVHGHGRDDTTDELQNPRSHTREPTRVEGNKAGGVDTSTLSTLTEGRGAPLELVSVAGSPPPMSNLLAHDLDAVIGAVR